MPNSGNGVTVQTSSGGPRHIPSKSITEPLPGSSHNKLHRHHDHHKHSRDKDDKYPPSVHNLLRPGNLGEGLLETLSPSGSRNHSRSRRASLRGSVDDISSTKEKKAVTDAELKDEIEKGVQRAKYEILVSSHNGVA